MSALERNIRMHNGVFNLLSDWVCSAHYGFEKALGNKDFLV